jgi:hypothetical protein
LTEISEVFTASIIRAMIEAVIAPDTSVNFHETARCNIPEECHFYISRRENLNSHTLQFSDGIIQKEVVLSQ